MPHTPLFSPFTVALEWKSVWTHWDNSVPAGVAVPPPQMELNALVDPDPQFPGDPHKALGWYMLCPFNEAWWAHYFSVTPGENEEEFGDTLTFMQAMKVCEQHYAAKRAGFNVSIIGDESEAHSG